VVKIRVPDTLQTVFYDGRFAVSSYLVGLLNRMTIKAIAASPFIHDAKKDHVAWQRHISPLWN